MRAATITINTGALRHNLTQVKKLAPNSKVLAMVKAGAYGHSVAACLPALEDADGVGVATFEEAREVRELGWTKTVAMIEGAFSEAEWLAAIDYKMNCLIHQMPQVDWALSHRPDFTNEPEHPTRTIWLKLNSGMNRLGFEPDEIIAVAASLHDAGYHIILASHFANADLQEHPYNEQQITLFNSVLAQLHEQVSATIGASLCNSAGTINFPDCHYDWVRPGIMLYGSSPLDSVTAQTLNLQPVMTFSTALMAIHDLTTGAAIGYGSRYRAEQPLKKGIISIGYGDGYPRVVSEDAWASLQQGDAYYRCPIIGRVAMDMIAIDVSAVPEPQLGDTIILWGDANTTLSSADRTTEAKDIANTVKAAALAPNVDDVAAWANTIGYELLCRMTPRPTRKII
ncbi:alanine racemase [Psychrobacter arenosus]|uniref:alanine racemase n=1 Tax=Psychrobacter arenosus TaxID=256326 RepID=UPI001918B51B|nr:alanine racemase [Psychrobacter arenosus]